MLKTNVFDNFLIEKFGYIKFIHYFCKRKQETNKILYDYENNVSNRTLRHQPKKRCMVAYKFFAC